MVDYLILPRCDYRFPVTVKKRAKSAGISTCVEDVVHTGFLVNEDLGPVSYTLFVNYFKSFVL